MEENLLVVKGLSKYYKIKTETLNTDNRFWALREVSFNLKKGEVLGVVGKNGAGKSTLLKVLSGIVKPSGGSIAIYGNSSSVLESGLGFQEDFTGRDNIIMNAQLLGQKAHDVKSNIEEIIDFSGIGDFIDMPLKKYSAGMQARLSTAVALLANPDLLLIDEQLFTGDFAFRQKVFDSIQKKVSKGLSAIIVSHSPQDLFNICNNCLLLSEGLVKEYGFTGNVLKKYLSESLSESTTNNGTLKTNTLETIDVSWDGNEISPGTEKIRLRQIKVVAINCSSQISIDNNFMVKVLFEKCHSGFTVQLHIVFYDMFKNAIFSTDVFSNSTDENMYHQFENNFGIFCYEAIIPKHFLYKGEYSIQLRFGTNVYHQEFLYLVPGKFYVSKSNEIKDFINDALPIYIRPRLSWKYSMIKQD
jgi:ABC-type polysaccharide/polyol phosphate transport system ATPase subunit